ncbi:hypothetical protein MDA_GLEAN10005591 [Myotis davidii]|uniref:Uncharacterized protein n=1 Tax=Myotis davidii TaxID=225400 RepID=L5MFD5_MYODS|nr:hypothetical protein MDA_GLEAN10005591 [Myotis davidii]
MTVKMRVHVSDFRPHSLKTACERGVEDDTCWDDWTVVSATENHRASSTHTPQESTVPTGCPSGETSRGTFSAQLKGEIFIGQIWGIAGICIADLLLRPGNQSSVPVRVIDV